jgi:plasmid stability protein
VSRTIKAITQTAQLALENERAHASGNSPALGFEATGRTQHSRRCRESRQAPHTRDGTLQAIANLLVRGLPDDVHAALQQRAKRDGQSLQRYVTRELTRIAQRPSLGEVLDRIERRAGGTIGLAEALDDLAEERSRD